MFGHVYYPETGRLPTSADTAIKIASSVGTVIGQISFGLLADLLGRKRMYGVELIIMIAAIFSLSLSGDAHELSIVGITIFWRLILGIGIGGDYPSSSVITSEFATIKWRGAMMASVFASQGFGQFAAALVSFITTAAFKSSLQTPLDKCDDQCQSALGKSWRILYGLGIVPAVIALYFRLTIPETIRYTLDVENDEVAAVADAEYYVSGRFGQPKRTGFRGPMVERRLPKASMRDFLRHFGRWKNGRVLLGTTVSWFLLDVAFYGVGLNTSLIIQDIGYAGDGNNTIYDQLYNIGVGNLILSVGGLIPGHFAAIATIDTLGRKVLQLGGFVILTALFSIIGFAWKDHISPGGLVALFCLCNFFSNFGPNTTTFIVPGEVFPTRYRSTAYGLSAAAGKVGSILSQALSGPLKNKGGEDQWTNHVMQIYAFFMFLGIFSSLLIPETKRKRLEELTGEEIYLPMELEEEGRTSRDSVVPKV